MIIEQGKNVPLGFVEIESEAPDEIRQHLGVHIDVFDIKTYEFQWNNSRVQGGLLAFALFVNSPARFFLADARLDGRYDHTGRAVYVRAKSPFIEAHEFTHAFVASQNPNLMYQYTRPRSTGLEIQDKAALYAIDEGLAQWVAIHLGFNSEDSQRLDEANFEQDKLVYEPLPRIKDALMEYQNDPRIKCGQASEFITDAHLEFLNKTYFAAMSLGFYFVSARLSRMNLTQPAQIGHALTSLIKNPPSFKELEKELS